MSRKSYRHRILVYVNNDDVASFLFVQVFRVIDHDILDPNYEVKVLDTMF